MLRCLQLRIHPTMSCPKPPFVSQPSNMSGRSRTQRDNPCARLTMQTGPTGQLLGPPSFLLFPPALIPINLHWYPSICKNMNTHGSSSRCPHRVLCYKRDPRAPSKNSYRRSSSHLLHLLPGSLIVLIYPPLGDNRSLPPTHLLFF